ncbi:hypothetical protein [Paenibacillus sp. V4I7]|nr:hypothetical protein [Paenibacillus sp. V4I7]MDQ0899213.1 hypothetical protein [Paenibacillus sp. V4I7]
MHYWRKKAIIGGSMRSMKKHSKPKAANDMPISQTIDQLAIDMI